MQSQLTAPQCNCLSVYYGQGREKRSTLHVRTPAHKDEATQATLLSPAHTIGIEGKGAPHPLQDMQMQPQLTAPQYNCLNVYYGHGREYLRDAKRYL